jgi:hypothetical protein
VFPLRTSRALVVAAAAIVLGCSRGEEAPAAVEVTPAPTPLPFLDCARQAFELGTAATRRRLEERGALTRESLSDLGEVSGVALAFGLAEVEREVARFRYLVESDPGRLVVDQGIDRFFRLEWTPEDDERLRARDPSYAELLERVARLRQQYTEHPSRNLLVERFHYTVEPSQANRVIENRLDEAREQVEALLERCQPLDGAKPDVARESQPDAPPGG